MSQHNQGQEKGHITSYKDHYWVWIALLVLTAITVGVARMEIPFLVVISAMLVATAKATMVLMYFMHLKYDKKILAGMVAVCLLVFFSVTIFSFADFLFR